MARLTVLGVLLFASTMVPASAEAQCGTFNADNGNNTIIVGETYNRVWVLGSPVYLPRNKAGVCWEDQNGVWQFTDFAGCNNTTPASNPLVINALGGDDIVSAHPGGFLACTASPGSIFLGAFPASFAFGLNAAMGAGADEFYGSPNADTAFSMTSSTSSNDSAIDTLCGYGGGDSLFGDTSDSSSDYECLVGGDGVEAVCDGRGGSPEKDFGMSCDGAHTSVTMVYGSTPPVPAESQYYQCGLLPGVGPLSCVNPCFNACPVSPPVFL